MLPHWTKWNSNKDVVCPTWLDLKFRWRTFIDPLTGPHNGTGIKATPCMESLKITFPSNICFSGWCLADINAWNSHCAARRGLLPEILLHCTCISWVGGPYGKIFCSRSWHMKDMHTYVCMHCKLLIFLYQFHSGDFPPGRKSTLRGELHSGVTQGITNVVLVLLRRGGTGGLNLPLPVPFNPSSHPMFVGSPLFAFFSSTSHHLGNPASPPPLLPPPIQFPPPFFQGSSIPLSPSTVKLAVPATVWFP